MILLALLTGKIDCPEEIICNEYMYSTCTVDYRTEVKKVGELQFTAISVSRCYNLIMHSFNK